jgi:hypothetical protein
MDDMDYEMHHPPEPATPRSRQPQQTGCPFHQQHSGLVGSPREFYDPVHAQSSWLYPPHYWPHHSQPNPHPPAQHPRLPFPESFLVPPPPNGVVSLPPPGTAPMPPVAYPHQGIMDAYNFGGFSPFNHSQQQSPPRPLEQNQPGSLSRPVMSLRGGSGTSQQGGDLGRTTAPPSPPRGQSAASTTPQTQPAPPPVTASSSSNPHHSADTTSRSEQAATTNDPPSNRTASRTLLPTRSSSSLLSAALASQTPTATQMNLGSAPHPPSPMTGMLFSV